MSIGTQLTNAAKESLVVAKDNAPLILTITSIGLGAGSTYMAVKVTPEAYDIYQKIMNDENLTPEQKRLEVIRNVIPLYGPAAVTGLASAGTGVLSYLISKKRLNKAYETIAGLGTAYMLAADGMQQYKKEIIDKFGENVDNEIQKKVAEKEAEKNHTRTDGIVIANDGPEEIMQDSISGQYFKNTRDSIYLIFNDIQKRLQLEDAIAASEYFYEADIDNCNLGDNVGWMTGDEPWPKFVDFKLPDGRDAVRVEVDVNPRFAAYRQYY